MCQKMSIASNLSPKLRFVILLAIIIASALVILCGMINLVKLISSDKIPASFSDIFSLILGVIAILVTIVFSRLSSDIKHARERLQELVTANEGDVTRLGEKIDAANTSIIATEEATRKEIASSLKSHLERVQSSIETLRASTEFERMLRGLKEIPQSTAAKSYTEPVKIYPQPQENSRAATDEKQAKKQRALLTIEELCIFRVFADAGEFVLSSDVFERHITKSPLDTKALRHALEGLRSRGCRC